jgi:hypothetical protein
MRRQAPISLSDCKRSSSVKSDTTHSLRDVAGWQLYQRKQQAKAKLPLRRRTANAHKAVGKRKARLSVEQPKVHDRTRRRTKKNPPKRRVKDRRTRGMIVPRRWIQPINWPAELCALPHAPRSSIKRFRRLELAVSRLAASERQERECGPRTHILCDRSRPLWGSPYFAVSRHLHTTSS